MWRSDPLAVTRDVVLGPVTLSCSSDTMILKTVVIDKETFLGVSRFDENFDFRIEKLTVSRIPANQRS